MRTIIKGMVVVAATAVLCTVQGAQAVPLDQPHPMCPESPNGWGEAGRSCYWDARHDGNGIGHSFVTNRYGDARTVPHWVAHQLLLDDLNQ